MGFPASLAMPMVALNRLAFCLASPACARMPLGKKILFPKADSSARTFGFSFAMVAFSSVASGFGSSKLLTVMGLVLSGRRLPSVDSTPDRRRHSIGKEAGTGREEATNQDGSTILHGAGVPDRRARREGMAATRVLLTLASLIVVVAGLKAAQPILIPVFLALLLAIICSPAVFWLRAHRVPTVAAVLIVVLLLFGVLTVFGAVVGGSINGFMDAAPRYQERIDALGTSATKWLRAQGVDVGEIDTSELFQPGSLMGYLGTGLTALLSTVSNTFVVTLILVFMLLEAAGLPVKIRAALGSPDADLRRLTKAAREIQKYLGLKTAISVVTGLLIGTWVAVLGLDFALTWGFLAFLLNFIPSIGSIIAAVPAVLLAAVQLGVGEAILVAAGFLAVNVVLGNIVEPQLMGRSLGMSTLVVFLSLIFWGWLWGPVGMFLSVPLTMILKIGMENSRDLKPIAIMLDSPRAAAQRLEAAAAGDDDGPAEPPSS